MVVHLTEKYDVAGHKMSMPYCGLDDSEKAIYTDYISSVTCKRCIKKFDAEMKKKIEKESRRNEDEIM